MLTDKCLASREARQQGLLLAVLCWDASPCHSSAFWQRLNAARLWRRMTWNEEPSAFLAALAEEVAQWNVKAVRAGLRLTVSLPDQEMILRPFRWAGKEWNLRQAFPLCDFRISGMT